MAQQRIRSTVTAGNKVVAELLYDDATGKVTGVSVTNTSAKDVFVRIATEEIIFPAGTTTVLPLTGSYSIVPTKEGRMLDFTYHITGPAI